LATLTTVLMVGIYRTHEAIEAAWKYFILGSVGIALALFGTILVYLAAQPILGEGLDAMTWTLLSRRAAEFDAALLNIAFVFLLLGYGTKAGLVPLHAWLPDAHAEGPTPISAVLSGLLLNVALYALLRFKVLLAANVDAVTPGPLMIILGLGIDPVRGLHALPPPRHQTLLRLFLDRAYGHHRLCLRHRRAGREFRRAPAHDHAFAHQVGDLFRRRPYRAGERHPAHGRNPRPVRQSSGARTSISRWCWPPASICRRRWSSGSSTSPRFSGELMSDLRALIDQGAPAAGHRPVPRVRVSGDLWRQAAAMPAEGRASLLSLWGMPGSVHMALIADDEISVFSLDCPDGRYPSVGAGHAPAIRLERAIADLYGLVADGAVDLRPWLDHGRWGISRPLGARRAAPAAPPPSKARACTRFPSARFMPASSSPAISASPPMARRWCASNSVSAMCTRAWNR
jgi:hypothetical protein